MYGSREPPLSPKLGTRLKKRKFLERAETSSNVLLPLA